MKRHLPPALFAGSVVAVALLLTTMAFTVTSARQLRQDAVDVQHSNDVLLSLQGVLATVKDAEASQRGYLITGQPKYLAPYRLALATIGRRVDELQALVRADPHQGANIVEVRRSVEATLGALEISLALRDRGGLAAAQQVMSLASSEAAIDALRLSAAAMSADETRRLGEREQVAAATYRNALVAGLGTGLAALVGVIAFLLLMRRHLATRDDAEAALAAEAERFRTTLRSVGDAVITTDLEGRITTINPVAEALTGWRGEEAEGRPLDTVFRAVDEATRAPVDNPAQRALHIGAVVVPDSPAVLLARSGEERPIDDSAAPIRSEAGAVAGAVLVFRDVSERRKAEAALTAAEARLRRAVMEMAVPTMVFAEDGTVLLVNDAWVNGAGYDRAEIGTIAEWTARAYPERAGFMQQHLGSLFSLSSRVDSGERTVTTAGGARRVWHFYTAPMGRDAAGRRVLVSNAIDVTERMRADERLRESEARLRFALDAAGLGQWELDLRDGSAQRTSRHDQIFGHDALLPEWSYERFLGHVLEEDRERVDRAFKSADGGDGTWDVACRIRRVDGEVRHIWTRARTLRQDSAGRALMVGIVGDNTREVEAVVALQDADRRKDEFVATLAHELRNPLAPLRNALAILAIAGADAGRMASARAVMDRQLRQLTRLVDDLLDASRIRLDKLVLRREVVTLASIVEAAVEACSPAIEQAGHALDVTLPTTTVLLDADPARLGQVVANLLGNACKFTPSSGRIRLVAEVADGEAVISVHDDGIGIAAEQLPAVFDMFAQVGGATGRGQAGLGIGLHLVRRVVEMHGGSAEARSDGLGHGSVFVVRLPVAAAR